MVRLGETRGGRGGGRVNDLERYFRQNTGRGIYKWGHYFDIYERYFGRFRGTGVRVMEIGVQNGGSLQMWKSYFGTGATIIGVDIDPTTKFAEPQIEVIIGDAGDRKFLDSLPAVDILIDDGSHKTADQIAVFERLFHRISDGGVYLCEDLHHPGCGSGFLEYAAMFLRLPYTMHHYPDVIVIERASERARYPEKTGTLIL